MWRQTRRLWKQGVGKCWKNRTEGQGEFDQHTTQNNRCQSLNDNAPLNTKHPWKYLGCMVPYSPITVHWGPLPDEQQVDVPFLWATGDWAYLTHRRRCKSGQWCHWMGQASHWTQFLGVAERQLCGLWFLTEWWVAQHHQWFWSFMKQLSSAPGHNKFFDQSEVLQFRGYSTYHVWVCKWEPRKFIMSESTLTQGTKGWADWTFIITENTSRINQYPF